MTAPVIAAGTVEAFDQKRVPNPEARKLESFPLFDWLRFVLASVVVLGHGGVALPGPLDAGLAVAVFLALSGWLIGGILLRSEPSDLPRFFYNRATRIWIPYAATFAAIYGLAALRDGIDLNWLRYAFYDLTFTHYNFVTTPRHFATLPLGGTGNHFWSISVEEQFYLFAPLLMFGLAWGKTLPAWLATAGILLAMDSRFAPIALGVVAAVLQRQHGDWHLRAWGRAVVLTGVAMSLLVMWEWDMQRTRALFAISVVMALATVGPRGRVGLFLGAISFPVYLNHWAGAFMVDQIAKLVALPFLVDKALIYILGVASGIVSWAIIDRPVMAYRAGWYTRARGRALGLTAYALLAIGLTGGLAILALGA